MAKTVFLKTHVEPFVWEKMKEWYLSHTFKRKKLCVGEKSDGTPARHEFDAVSEKDTIVAEIKTHSWLTSGGNIPSGKTAALFQSLYFLSLVKADTKLLILTDRKTCEYFRKISDGKVADNIEIRYCELSQELQAEVNTVQRQASQEMSQS
jgi:hypothetical protein